MNETSRAVLVIVVSAAVVVVAYVFFLRPFFAIEPQVQGVINANSTWSVTMQEYELQGPLSAETFRVSNDNGKTTMFYAATNRAGTETKEFTVPLIGPEGTFMFEALRADGLWDLDDKAMLPHPVDEYIVEVDQTLGDEGGTRAFGFSDPRYWATTTAHAYQMVLPPKNQKTTSEDLIGAADRGSLRDPRYLQIVQTIRAFGPGNVLAAENKIRSELAATAQHPIAPR